MAATRRSPPSQQLLRRVTDRVLKLPGRSLEGAYTNYRRYLPYKEVNRLSKGRAPFPESTPPVPGHKRCRTLHWQIKAVQRKVGILDDLP